MEAEATELREGQIFRWRWADEEKHHEGQRVGGSYHCKSQIAIVKNGRLLDTYWSDGGEEALDPSKVILTPWCDISWPTISRHDVPLYDAADIADTRHPNSSNAPIYLRPGAQRSPAAILAELDHRKELAESDMRVAQSRLERYEEMRALVAAGKLDQVWI